MIPLTSTERRYRAKVAIGTAAVYAAVMGIIYLVDPGGFPAMNAGLGQLIVHSHIGLALVAIAWIIGYEWLNPIIVLGLMIDWLVIARDRISWAGVGVVLLAAISLLYAAYRTYHYEEERRERVRHDH